MFVNLILKDLVVENKFNVMNLIEKVEEAKNAGVKRLVIAPYYYDEESKSSIDEVKVVVDDINLYLNESQSDIKLYAANLIRSNYDNVREFIDGRLGSINDTKYVLLNASESTELKELIEIIYEFNLRDYVPVIVAPERIKEIIDNYKNINKLIEKGCLFQLDVASLNGEYGSAILKTAKLLKKKEVYNFVGFEDSVKAKYINKDIESLSKKGLGILTKNAEINSKIAIKKRKIGSFIHF